jgi:putative ABC transport system permease protein
MAALNTVLRRLARQPGYTLTVIVTLALGLGANTAMFSFADGLLFRPLALPHLEQLVTVWLAPEAQPDAREAVAPGDFLDWEAAARSFDSLAALQGWSADLTGDGPPEQLAAARVTGGFFETLGIQARVGRLFGHDAVRDGADSVVVVSEALWRRRLESAAGVAGRELVLNGRTYAVAGVVAAAQAYPVGTDVWVPLAFDPAARQDRDRRDLEVVGRLGSDVPVARAEADLRTLAARGDTLRAAGGVRRQPRLVGLREHLLANSEAPAYLLIVVLAATFLLVLACANVANLEVAQMHGRLRELVIRASLGASPARLVRQVMAESTLLCLGGGGAGLLVAWWTIQLIRASLPPDLLPFVPGWSAVALNVRALAYAGGAAVVAGLLAGLAPAWMIPRGNLDAVLRQGARGSSSGGRHRLRQALVVIELALALVMVVACGLVVKTFAGLVLARHGFESERVLTLRINLPPARYAAGHERSRFYDEALREIASLPGVEAASLTSTLPFFNRETAGFAPTRTDAAPRTPPSEFDLQAVTPDHFRTFGIGVLQGRGFTTADHAGTAPVAVVSEHVAGRLWPGESALGRTLWQNPADAGAIPLTVVGVVTEVRRDWRHEAPGGVYVPFAQAPRPAMFLSLRTAGNPTRHIGAVRSRIQRLDAAQPLPQPKPMKQVVVESMAGLFITAGVLTFMGLVALLVAAGGIYSVVANSVSQRTREIGIRMALGARPLDVLRQVLGEGVRMAAVGVGVGLPVAIVVSGVFRHSVHGIPPLEAGWFVLLALGLLGVTLVACYLPARRAAAIDPLVALRAE